MLLHDPALRGRSDLVHGVLEAAAVAVEIACLRVEVRLQLEEVESSRARIVQAGVRSAGGWSATCTTARSSGS